MKIRKYGALLLIVAMLISILCPATPVAAADTTQVTFRVVSLHHLSTAWCNVFLSQYPDMTSMMDISDGSFKPQFTISRIANWEYTLELNPGFYEIRVVLPGLTDDPVVSDTPRFEVKGDKMTVYICAEDSVEKVPRPDEWLVYGEDSQDFFIWADESDASSEDTSPDINTSVDVESLPEFDNSNVPEDPPARPEVSTPQTEETDKPEESKTQSAKIGDYLFIGIALALLAICLILLHRQQKRRGA